MPQGLIDLAMRRSGPSRAGRSRIFERRFFRRCIVLTAVLVGLISGKLAHSQHAGEARGARLGAKVFGRVSVTGSPAAPVPLQVFKNRDFCGAAVPNETLLVSRDGGLRNAVVTLRSLDRIVAAPPGRIVLDNEHCAFVPHVQVALLGSELLLKNSDPILHTVHARMGKETQFNVGLPTWRRVTKRLDRPGVIRIDCDVLHTWMSAVIVVVRTPYFSVTDTNGNFSMEGMPAGSYDMEVWHERLGVKTARVRLEENGTIYADVFFSSKSPR